MGRNAFATVSAMRNKGVDAYGSRSVANALHALVLLGARRPVRLTDVSARLGVAPSTAHRLLATLRAHGFAEQEPGGRRYRAGPALLALARGEFDQRSLLRAARAELDRLRDESGETANLLTLDGPDAFFLDGAEARRTLRVAPRTGDHVPAYGTAGGKVLLAQLPADVVRMRYPDGLRPLTPLTRADLPALLRDLAVCRRTGHALNLGESVLDVHAVAVAVPAPDGPSTASLTVSAPSTRLTRARALALVPLLKERASALAARL